MKFWEIVMIRRFGENVKSGIKYTRRAGVYALLPVNGGILLTHQMEPEPEFQLPGGGVDTGEQPISALHREVMEETGWTISNVRRLGAFRRYVFMPEYNLWAEKVCTVFIANPVLRRSDPTEVGHSDHIVPISLAAELVENPADRSFILEYVCRN